MKKLFLLLCLSFSINAMAFDTWWHAECTRKAMVANGFSPDARLATQVSNYLTDIFPAFTLANEKLNDAGLSALHLNADPSYEYMHFDAIFTLKDIESNWNLLLNNTIRALRKYAVSPDVKPGFRQIVLYNIIGASLHTVQDFYSHSNWVNRYIALGQKTAIPIWFETATAERMRLNLSTGAYPDGSKKGKLNHGDLNKDCSNRNLNIEAVEVATRASIDWVKRLMDSTSSDVPWSDLKTYDIQKNMVMKRFLVTLDATFLTTSSIVADHFDGAKPVKFVFSPEKDPVIEFRLARTALMSTLQQYTANMALKDNVYGLPSPYWSGHMVYHITRDIAFGLMLNEKTYVQEYKEKKLQEYKPKNTP